jgi:GH15 family glucan-1,4-alpha-glucosidase
MFPHGPRLRAHTSHDIDSLGTPIEDYALLGDTRSAALVGPEGSIDWLCVPRFDGRPLFGRLVGGPAAGSFSLAPPAPSASRAAATGPNPSRSRRPGTPMLGS